MSAKKINGFIQNTDYVEQGCIKHDDFFTGTRTIKKEGTGSKVIVIYLQSKYAFPSKFSSKHRGACLDE